MENATKGQSQQAMNTAFGITIYRSDIQTLEGLNWLNDQASRTVRNTLFQHMYKVYLLNNRMMCFHRLLTCTSNLLLTIADQKKGISIECTHLAPSSMRSSLRMGTPE